MIEEYKPSIDEIRIDWKSILDSEKIQAAINQTIKEYLTKQVLDHEKECGK
jgi:hypothetical protein